MEAYSAWAIVEIQRRKNLLGDVECTVKIEKYNQNGVYFRTGSPLESEVITTLGYTWESHRQTVRHVFLHAFLPSYFSKQNFKSFSMLFIQGGDFTQKTSLKMLLKLQLLWFIYSNRKLNLTMGSGKSELLWAEKREDDKGVFPF